MRRRSAILAASFVVVVGGCRKKNVTEVVERIAVRDGRCVRLTECTITVKYNDEPCDKPTPPPEPIDCPLNGTVRKVDGKCYFPHKLRGSDSPFGEDDQFGGKTNPPPPLIPAEVVCPAGVKDYVPGKYENGSQAGAGSPKAAASASASASK